MEETHKENPTRRTEGWRSEGDLQFGSPTRVIIRLDEDSLKQIHHRALSLMLEMEKTPHVDSKPLQRRLDERLENTASRVWVALALNIVCLAL